MRLSDFDYSLPKELIAQYPAKERDNSRMMVLNRRDKSIQHKRFKDIVSYLNKEDVVVLNDSRVVPARVFCKRETGGHVEIFLLRRLRDNLYEALVRPASRLFSGRRVICEDGKTIAEIVRNSEVGKIVKFANIVNIEKQLKRLGSVPLPPYIKRKPDKSDEERYQTIYAKRDGSTAAPTAGLHFTKETLQQLWQKGITTAYVTLHVSYGTFAPVKVEDIQRHKVYKEFFELPKETLDLLYRAKIEDRRVIAIGTTTARVLEYNTNAILSAGINKRRTIKGWTDLFIYPPYNFKVIDGLLTNFHLPKSTLLMLVSAFCGREFILKAYYEAVRERYRFYSYGDCMLII